MSYTGSARQNEPGAVHGVARHHDEGPAAHAHHEGQPAVRPHLLLIIMRGKVNIYHSQVRRISAHVQVINLLSHFLA